MTAPPHSREYDAGMYPGKRREISIKSAYDFFID
jgi:hypothetical protein